MTSYVWHKRDIGNYL